MQLKLPASPTMLDYSAAFVYCILILPGFKKFVLFWYVFLDLLLTTSIRMAENTEIYHQIKNKANSRSLTCSHCGLNNQFFRQISVLELVQDTPTDFNQNDGGGVGENTTTIAVKILCGNCYSKTALNC